jgi:uncharacterized RDD family membrane protein YckC
VTYPDQPQHQPYTQGPPPGYPQGAYGVPVQAYYGQPPVPLAPNGQPLANFGLRLGAFLIDGLIITALSLAVMIPAVFVLIAWVGSQAQQVKTDPVTGEITESPDLMLVFGPVIVGYLAIFVAIYAVNYVYCVELFPSRRGVTLGKRVLGLALVRLDDPSAPITRGVAGKRWLMQHIVGLVVPFFSLLDGLWQLWDKPYQQCLHDKVAQTVVVKVNT